MTRPNLPIYLDYQATTPLDGRVLDVMMPYMTTKFGNPHSINHSFGWEASAGVEKARREIAALIGADEEEVVFTSGATESNNLAIKGMAYALYPDKNHIVTVCTEHSCVIESCRSLEQSGLEVTYLPVGADGILDLDLLAESITDKTGLVSVMAVNNEIGVIQYLAKISRICRDKAVCFHTDAAQGVGKIPLDMKALEVDLMSISGHKLYGPKGIGALYVNTNLKPQPVPLFSGGGQERGLRSGTLAPALCAGLGAACALAEKEMEQDNAHVQQLAGRFLEQLQTVLDGITVNGSRDKRWPGNLNLTFEGVKSDILVSGIRDIALSTGAACSAATPKPSHVLTALGLDRKKIDCSVRVGFGRMSSEAEVDFATDLIIEAVQKARNPY
ncbi:cysteine desulfurase family protein [Emcibacter sp.]|uniref:cysteine desulfurase family protein n=1 Tax=Emcibacter sp. TaxID=1979954 RepID=UPI002AA71A96|nr:aminotransferase class V-fold PLP-dependent enzyme [Emcibacter sp.]